MSNSGLEKIIYSGSFRIKVALSKGCQFSLTINVQAHILDRLTCGIQQWEEAGKVGRSMSFKIIVRIPGNPIH